MALTPVLGTVEVRSNYNSIAYKLPYTDDDDGTINSATIDMPKISTTAPASVGATSLSVSAIPTILVANSYISFFNGVRVLTTAQAAKGATSLTVQAISGDIPSGTQAFFSDVQFKKASDTNWRFFLPMWPTMINSLLGSSGGVGDIDATQTTLTAFSNTGNRFQEDGLPFDIFLDTERITVGAVSGTAWSNLTRSVNGVVASHIAGEPIVRVGGDKAIFGSLFPLEPNTEYNVRLLITDGNNEYVTTFNGTTRAELATIGTTTHYVNSRTGSDSNDGLTTSTAWETLEKAVQEANIASAPMIVEVEGGYYMRPVTAISNATHRLTFKAANSSTCVPAVNDAQEVQSPSGFTPTVDNPGRVIVYDKFTAPTGSTDPVSADWANGYGGRAPWTQVIEGGQTLYYLDIFTVGGVLDAEKVQHLAYVHGNTPTDKLTHPRLNAFWNQDTASVTPNLSNAAGFGELVRINTTISYGHWQGATRIYVRMPDDIDPNECYIWLGTGKRGFTTTDNVGFDIGGAAGHRIYGIQIRCCTVGVRLLPGAKNATIDHCYIEAAGASVMFHGDTTENESTAITGTTIQNCLLQNTGLWSDDPVTNRRIPWFFIKSRIYLPGTIQYPTPRLGDTREDSGIALRHNVADLIVRDVTMNGFMNGINNFGGAQTTVKHEYNVDLYRVKFHNICDNPIEPEGPLANWKCWNIQVTDSANVCGTDDFYGPVYIVNVIADEIGNWGITDDGKPTGTPTVGAGSGVVKFGCSTPPRMRFHLINWTVRTTKKHPLHSEFKGFVGGAAGNPFESFMILNTIWIMNNKITEFGNNGIWLVDEANFYASTAGGLQYDGRSFNSSLVSGNNATLDAWRKWDRINNVVDSVIHRGEYTNKLAGVDYALVGSNAIASAGLHSTLSPIEDGLFYQSGVPVPGFDIPYPGTGSLEPYHMSGNLPNRGGIQTIPGAEPEPPPVEPPPTTSTGRKANKTRKARVG